MEKELLENSVQLVVVGTLSLIISFCAIFLFIILYQKRMIRAQKEKQMMETKFQKDILHSYIDTQEIERKRIAADLHDNVGAALAAVKMMINRIKPKEDIEKELLVECKRIIQDTANSTREISHNLLPPSLETLGIIKVLERMAKNINSDHIKMILTVDKSLELKKSTELNLFRIVQEMMNNTLKYAKASEILVTITDDNENIAFSYSDNGIGFSTENSNGLGFKNIQTRAEMMHAKHKFFSEKNQKNGIHILIPKQK